MSVSSECFAIKEQNKKYLHKQKIATEDHICPSMKQVDDLLEACAKALGFEYKQEREVKK